MKNYLKSEKKLNKYFLKIVVSEYCHRNIVALEYCRRKIVASENCHIGILSRSLISEFCRIGKLSRRNIVVDPCSCTFSHSQGVVQGVVTLIGTGVVTY